MPDTFVKIASVTVGSGGAASIDFTSIPSTYTDLCFYYSLRVDTTDSYGRININGNTTTKIRIYGDGAAVGSDTNANVDFRLNPSGSTSNTFGNGSLYIPNYAGSANKSYSIDSVYENNGTTAFMQLLAGLRSATAAITSVSLLPQSGNFVQYSTATLYGIKNS